MTSACLFPNPRRVLQVSIDALGPIAVSARWIRSLQPRLLLLLAALKSTR